MVEGREQGSGVRSVLRNVLLAPLGSVVALAVVAWFTERWVFATWVGLTMDELAFYLGVSLGGTNPDVIWGYVWNYGVSELVVLALLWLLGFLLRELPCARRVYLAGLLVASVAALGWVAADVDRRLGVREFISGEAREPDAAGTEAEPAAPEEEWELAAYVGDASSVRLTFPEKRRNLVYIFLESMEMTFADVASGGAFEVNVIPELTALAQEGEDFSGADEALEGAISYPGTTWTSGAMCAQTTGWPVVNARGGDQLDTVFPDVWALGDVLASEGYRQDLLLGSEAAFGARDRLFGEHGGYNVHDYWGAIEDGYIENGRWVFWGHEDEILFERARDLLVEMAAGEEPFNLTMLTVDTHFEDGYLCDLCWWEFDDQYANVMACSSRQVAGFVRWVQEQPFYGDTTIVICGDHPTMDSDFCADVPAGYLRRTFTAIINPAVSVAEGAGRRQYATFDLYPTTLAALGVRIEGERLGLGTNLFSDEPTITEAFGYDQVREWMLNRRRVYGLLPGEETLEPQMEWGAYVA